MIFVLLETCWHQVIRQVFGPLKLPWASKLSKRWNQPLHQGKEETTRVEDKEEEPGPTQMDTQESMEDENMEERGAKREGFNIPP